MTFHLTFKIHNHAPWKHTFHMPTDNLVLWRVMEHVRAKCFPGEQGMQAGLIGDTGTIYLDDREVGTFVVEEGCDDGQ